MAEASQESEQKSSRHSSAVMLSTKGMEKRLLKGLDVEPGLLDESHSANQSVIIEHDEVGKPGVKKISLK